MSRKRADVVLVERGLFESRAKARAAIEAGGVVVDGVKVAKPSDLVEETAEVVAEPPHPWVGRGALKLAHALNLWPVQVAGRTVLDVGASTGGFTQVCLAHGAARVFAVDVGRDQLHPSLRGDPRVVSLEGVDARRLTAELIGSPPQLVVCDASFISLSKVLQTALDLTAPDSDLVALIKPQFEAGPERVGKGGVVKDEAVRRAVVREVSGWLESCGWIVQALTESPITGADGNVEFLIWAARIKKPPGPEGAGGQMVDL